MIRRMAHVCAQQSVVAVVASLAMFAMLVTPAAAHDGERHDVLLTGGQWWDGDKFVSRERTWTVDGALATASTGTVADTIDLAGKWVLPAFADAHTHVLSDTNNFARALRGLLAAGILFAENPNNPGASVADIRKRLDHPGTLEMRFANGGLTSPGGHPVQIYEPNGPAGERLQESSAYFEIADREALEAAWPKILAGRPDLIKVYLESSEFHAQRSGREWFGKRGLDPALLPEIVRLARAAHLGVAAHVTSAADFRTAVAAGVHEIAHLPLAPLTREDCEAAARAGVTVVTTAVSHRSSEFHGDLDAVHRDNLRLLRAAHVPIVLGTDHPLMNVVDEVLALHRIGGFTDIELLQLLTAATPAYVAPGRKLGLKPNGDEATFVVLDADPLADLANLKKVAWSMKQGWHVELPVLPPMKPGVADSMAPFLMRGDLAGAFAAHERLKRERPDDLDFGEQQLNGLGYQMLQHGAKDGAVAILHRNTELFPASGNVWDSLADAQLAVSDSAGAAASYRRVLEVLPGNTRYRAEYRETMEKRARAFLAMWAPKSP